MRAPTWTLLLLAALCTAGCRKKSPREVPAGRSGAVDDATAPRPPECPEPMPLRHSADGRVVAIGDLHGDLQAARWALRRAGAIDASDRWIGGKLVVVQVGDVLDRGDGEREILDLLQRLKPQAAAAGGKILTINGNHELMNALGDFRYVTSGGFDDYADGAASAQEGRLRAFQPGGASALRLAASGIAVVVDDTLFAHGGVEPQWAGRLNDENRHVQCWLAGAEDEVPPSAIDASGPLWSRAFGQSNPDCELLGEVLSETQVARMVVGHTIQPGGVSSACSGRLWRIDVGMAAHYGGPRQLIAIRGDDVAVLEGEPQAR